MQMTHTVVSVQYIAHTNLVFHVRQQCCHIQQGLSALLQHIGGARLWTQGSGLQKAAAKQQSMLDDEASSSGDDDEDDGEDDEEEDSDEDDVTRKERSIAYLKKALTSQPLNGNADSDDDGDDNDMEVGPA